MISVDDALALVAAVFPPLAGRRIPLGDSLGCVAAERVGAAEPSPPVAVSAMDGYALRSGEDVRAGDALLEPGDVLGPARMALLAGAAVAELAVVPPPLVGVLSSGP